MANTVIQLKYSNATGVPPTLNLAEPAYSNVTNTLWIYDGTGVVAIGGKAYTDKINSSTDANTANTLVKRDNSGNFSANVITATIYGNSNTATALETSRNFSINGDDVDSATVGFNGTSPVVLQGNLKTTGVSSGTYGGTSNIAVFTVDTKGRISYAANVSISTSLTVASDTGQDTIALATDTLNLIGGDGISTVTDAGNNKITFNVDNTIIRTTGNQSITGDLSLTGNLSITGNLTSLDIDTIRVDDPIIQLAANNESSDAVDIGFLGHYSDDAGVTKRHTGLVRHASDGKYYLFKNYIDASLHTNTPNNIIDVANTSFQRATLDADIVGGNVSSLFSDIAVADGGTGRSTFTSGAILIGNGTGGLNELANTGTAATYGENSRTLIVTTDTYGRVSAVSNVAIAIDTSQIISGTLGVPRGGTGSSSFTANGVVISAESSTGALTAVTGTEGQILQINASGIPVFEHLNGGTF